MESPGVKSGENPHGNLPIAGTFQLRELTIVGTFQIAEPPWEIPGGEPRGDPPVRTPRATPRGGWGGPLGRHPGGTPPCEPPWEIPRGIPWGTPRGTPRMDKGFSEPVIDQPFDYLPDRRCVERCGAARPLSPGCSITVPHQQQFRPSRSRAAVEALPSRNLPIAWKVGAVFQI